MTKQGILPGNKLRPVSPGINNAEEPEGLFKRIMQLMNGLGGYI